MLRHHLIHSLQQHCTYNQRKNIDFHLTFNMALSSTIMRLFASDSDSPVPSASSNWNDSDIEAVLTPLGKGYSFFSSIHGNSSTLPVGKDSNYGEDKFEAPAMRKGSKPFLIDEDSGLGMETDLTEDEFQLSSVSSFIETETNTDFNDSFSEMTISRKPFSMRRRSSSAKKKLFSNKRTAELQDADDDLTPSLKKFRNSETNLLKFALTNSPIPAAEPDVQCIIQAVDRLTTEVDLVADGSRGYSLPTIAGKHSDLKAISPDTMADVVSNPCTDPRDVMIIDCRYPYEYEGGHIKEAVNLYTKEEVHNLLELSETEKPRVLIFHCEFSSERGPKMYRFLRSCDRDLNKDNYPTLNFPEVYLLEGGYKEFYYKHQNLCEPLGYKPMLHKDHASDLRHFRVKSKSWAGGQQRKHPSKSRLSRSCLSLKY